MWRLCLCGAGGVGDGEVLMKAMVYVVLGFLFGAMWAAAKGRMFMTWQFWVLLVVGVVLVVTAQRVSKIGR